MPTPRSATKSLRRWSIDEVQYLVEHAHTKLPAEIAVDLGRTKASVRSFAYHRGIITRNALRRLYSTYKERNARQSA